MTVDSPTADRVRGGLGEISFEEIESRDEMLSLRAELECVSALMQGLRELCDFEVCTLVTAVDHDSAPPAPRFEMIWQLQSVTHSDRVRVHAFLDGHGVGDEAPKAPSVTAIWPGAAYCERECHDMFGVLFEGHEGLKRILLPEAYEHFPLRKDFPHQGIEPDRLYKEWDRTRRQPTGEAS